MMPEAMNKQDTCQWTFFHKSKMHFEERCILQTSEHHCSAVSFFHSFDFKHTVGLPDEVSLALTTSIAYEALHGDI